MLLCRNCGSQIQPDQNFCLECGSPVKGTEPTAFQANSTLAMPQAKTRTSSTALIIAGLLATAAVSVTITVLALRGRNNNPQPQASPSAVKPADSTPMATSPSTSPTSASPTPPGLPPVRITATASSTRASMNGNNYEANSVLDPSLDTAWVEGVSGPGIGEWIRCDFDREVTLRRINIAPGYFKNPQIWLHNNRLAAATFYFSDGSSRHFNFPDRMQLQSLDVGRIKTHWVRMTIDDIYGGSVDSEDTPISQLTFSWEL